MLSIKNLKFSYGDHEVLRGLSAEIKSGAVTTLMGANGCGKTTLLSLLTKNLKPAEGSILLDGQNLAGISLKDFARRVAIVHQKNAAPNDLTVEKLVSYGRLPYSSIFRAGLDEKNQEQVERAMALTGLLPLKDRRIGTSASGLLSPWRWPRIRSCCFWMSPPRRWTCGIRWKFCAWWNG